MIMKFRGGKKLEGLQMTWDGFQLPMDMKWLDENFLVIYKMKILIVLVNDMWTSNFRFLLFWWKTFRGEKRYLYYPNHVKKNYLAYMIKLNIDQQK